MTTTAALEQIFAYGQTRGQYAMTPGESLRTRQIVTSLVRREHLCTVRQALLLDQPAMARKLPHNQWQLQLSPVSRQCLWEMHSGIFLRLLENISGQTHLLPDSKCHLLHLHTQNGIMLSLTDWQDPETQLPVALYLLLGLESGNAIVTSRNDQLLMIEEPTLQAAFFHYAGDAT